MPEEKWKSRLPTFIFIWGGVGCPQDRFFGTDCKSPKSRLFGSSLTFQTVPDTILKRLSQIIVARVHTTCFSVKC